MAHASPEMTLVYARILDETMQRKWEEAVAQGAVQIKNWGKLQGGAIGSRQIDAS